MIVMIPVTPVNRGVGIHVRQLTLIIAVLMQHDVVMAVMRNEQCLMPAVARRPQNRARELRKDEQMPDSAHGGHQTADNWIPEKLHRGLRR